MPRPHKRPVPGPPLDALIAVRRAKYPQLLQRDFAEMLGITRLHMSAIETGRRAPSLELAARWLQLLAPQAKIWMFGDVPIIEERIRNFKRLQKLAPDFFKAA